MGSASSGSLSLGSKRERERPDAWVARQQGQHVPSSRRTGDQANHAGTIEARDSVSAGDVAATVVEWQY